MLHEKLRVQKHFICQKPPQYYEIFNINDIGKVVKDE